MRTRISLTTQLKAVDTVLNVFGLPISNLDGAAITFLLDDERENIDLTFLGVSPRVGAVTLGGFGFELRGQSGELQLEGRAAQLGLGGGKFGFSEVIVTSEYSDGNLSFGVSSDTTTRVLGEVKLNGDIQLYDTAVVFSLDGDSHLDVSGERWTIDGGNRLRWAGGASWQKTWSSAPVSASSRWSPSGSAASTYSCGSSGSRSSTPTSIPTRSNSGARWTPT